MIDKLISLSTYLLAISLATERLVALIKTIIPPLGKEPLHASGLIDEKKERIRTIFLQLIAFGCAYVTVYLWTGDAQQIPMLGEGEPQWPTWLVAALSCGGSTFWSNILGYANAVKDIKKQQRAEQRMLVASQAAARQVPVSQMSTR
jgi:hypothetical protein